MVLYTSRIIRTIFSNLDGEEKCIITQTDGKSIGSGQFKKNIVNLAKNFSQMGIGKSHGVAIFVRDSILFSNIVLSGILAGARIILLDPALGKQILIEKIQSSDITYIVLEGRLYDFLFLTRSDILTLPINFTIHGLSIFGWRNRKLKTLLMDNTTDILYEDVAEMSDCISVFTGGTTEVPKCVIHSFHSLFFTFQKMRYFLQGTKIFYADMPHFLLLGLMIGVPIIAGSPSIQGKRLQKIFEKYPIDTYFSPPYKYNYFLEKNIQLPKSLTNILLGSAPIYNGFLKKLHLLITQHQKITCIYGMTELLPIASIDSREKVGLKIDGDILGNCIEGIQYKIINNELYVKGVHKMKGYRGIPETEYIATGDLVKIVEEKIVMIGRKKDMIIRRDYNIYPGLYEPIISQIPGVQGCAMIGVYDEQSNDEKIFLYIGLFHSSEKYTQYSMLKKLKSGKYSIDQFALPDTIIFMTLPRVGRQQKIDKNLLRNYSLGK